MAFSGNARVSAKQTSYNVGATVVSALAQAGVKLNYDAAIDILKRAAGEVFEDLAAELAKEPVGQTQSANRYDNPGTVVLKSGRHEGQKLQDVPRSYTEWLATDKNKNEWLRTKAKAFLAASTTSTDGESQAEAQAAAEIF